MKEQKFCSQCRFSDLNIVYDTNSRMVFYRYRGGAFQEDYKVKVTIRHCRCKDSPRFGKIVRQTGSQSRRALNENACCKFKKDNQY